MSGKINIPLVGGLFAGVAASVCCVGPLLLLFLGIGGAWVSHLTALEPYRPLFISVAVIALFMAYLRIYRVQPELSCQEGNVCAKPETALMYKRLFIAVVLLVLVSVFSPYLIPILFV